MFRTVLLIGLFLWIKIDSSFGQCCSAGNPVGGDGSNEGLSKNELRIFTSYKHSLSKEYFYHDSKADIPFVEKSYFDFQNLSMTYGISPRLSAHAELGYFYNKTQDLKFNNNKEEIRSHGLGDISLNIRFIALKTVKPISQLVFSAGIKAPIGEFSEEMDGITIPISLQPSSGALKYNVSAFYMRKRLGHKLGWNSFTIFEYSQTINRGFLIYKYGNYFQYSIAGTYAINKNLNVIVNAKFEWRERDKREAGLKIESTGSSLLYFNPQLMYDFKHKWSAILMADLPVYKYVNGYQMTNQFSVQVGLRKSFSFTKKEKSGETHKE